MSLSPDLRQLLVQNCQDTIAMAQKYRWVSLTGYSAAIGLAILSTSLLITGKLAAGSLSSMTTLPVIASTRALDRSRKQLEAECQQLCQTIHILDDQ